LPDNARISLRARTLSPEGDVKLEAWGDGHSGYTGDPRLAYTATGYVFILGGWQNTISAIVRQHEHAPDRSERHDFRLEPGRWYRWVIERRDGHLTWAVDGQPFLELTDPRPLHGADHHAFAFSGWQTTVEFDDLAIESL
jgi:Farnesoic acid 0-methyl transferase